MQSDTDALAPLNVAILTVSDTRTLDSDKSGTYLQNSLTETGHLVCERALVVDDIYQIRAISSKWIAATNIHCIMITGGTGFTERDSTPEAMQPLFDKTVDGFGELFRHYSIEEVGSSTVQSRALAGFANKTLIFCLPGSTNACQTAWQKIIRQQLDNRHKPCNFATKLLEL